MPDTGTNPVITLPGFADPRIGAEFHARRELLGLSGDSVAARLKWSPSKISRIENARTACTGRALTALCEFYQLDAEVTAALEGLARQAQIRKVAAARDGDEDDLLCGADLAATVLEWSPQFVPRLLQVPGYAHAVAASRGVITPVSPGQVRVEAKAAARWQAQLTCRPPTRLRAVLDESVLRRPPGGAPPELMRAQLEHLAAASRLPGTDIEVRVLPLSAGWPVLPGGAFTYLAYPELACLTTASDVILTETLDGLYRPDLSERQVWLRRLAFDRLWELAEPPEAAVAAALAAAWDADLVGAGA